MGKGGDVTRTNYTTLHVKEQDLETADRELDDTQKVMADGDLAEKLQMEELLHHKKMNMECVETLGGDEESAKDIGFGLDGEVDHTVGDGINEEKIGKV
ncbi:hypothetical protein GUJ93_ZPchr0007g3707 [Zizania palustris]|uniref:Uncharacterized protein n=1 Tax=Zizania palustris TaxID=103762 RepID=A0A8J5SVJ0_ZIZPA|nr:hypothetical protein GUJ93_ZPchr0007g3707 [Zizania palustris]